MTNTLSATDVQINELRAPQWLAPRSSCTESSFNHFGMSLVGARSGHVSMYSRAFLV